MTSTKATSLALVLVSFTAGAAFAQGPKPIGFIVDCVGEWVAQPEGRILKAGDNLAAGVELKPKGNSATGHVTVCLFTGEVRTIQGTARLEIPDQPALAERVWTALRTRFESRFVHTLSRGDVLADAVLSIDGASVDVAGVTTAISRPTQVQLRFQRLDASAQPVGKPVGPLPVIANPSGAFASPSADLGVGLWRVTLYRLVSDAPESTGETAWALVVPPDQRDEIRKEYLDLFNTLNERSKGASVETVRGLLRAYLLDLADQIGGKK